MDDAQDLALSLAIDARGLDHLGDVGIVAARLRRGGVDSVITEMSSAVIGVGSKSITCLLGLVVRAVSASGLPYWVRETLRRCAGCQAFDGLASLMVLLVVLLSIAGSRNFIGKTTSNFSGRLFTPG